MLFVPAGTLAWWQAWLLIAILFVPMLVAGAVLLARSPDLLRRRLSARETESEQRLVVGASAAVFLAAFVAAGLGRRFGWPTFPAWVSCAAAIAFLVGYALYAEVMRENVFLSRTIEVQAGQTVVEGGLYGVVRHPMYAATLLMFGSMPLVLGSAVSLAIMLLYVPIIVARIRNEEAVLENGLEGYAAYKTRVRYRLIPHLW
jgi:protein-S-isoprenylcysteine O-methyltransferase Ste14